MCFLRPPVEHNKVGSGFEDSGCAAGTLSCGEVLSELFISKGSRRCEGEEGKRQPQASVPPLRVWNDEDCRFYY